MMKIDSLWLKMFGVMMALSVVYWALSATIPGFSNVFTGTPLFSLYVMPAILPLAPFAESLETEVFVPLFGALVFFLPLFWSLVLYGIVRAVRMIRSRV